MICPATGRCTNPGAYQKRGTASRQISFTPLSNQTSGAVGNGQKISLSLSFSLLLPVILTGREHKHLSAFYTTSWPVLNSSRDGDGAGGKWSYIAVRGCQRFNNREPRRCSHTLTGMQIFPFVCFLDPRLLSHSTALLSCLCCHASPTLVP